MNLNEIVEKIRKLLKTNLQYEELLLEVLEVLNEVMDLPAKKLVDSFLQPRLKQITDIKADMYLAGEGVPVVGTDGKIYRLRKLLSELLVFLEKEYPSKCMAEEHYYDWELENKKYLEEHMKLVKKIINQIKQVS